MRQRKLLGLLLGAAAFLAAVLALTLTPAARATEPVAFTDPAGDAGGAPDVTGVTVSERDGIFKVVIDATAVKTETGYTYVSTVLDSDRNKATGDANGIDYWFSFGYDQGEPYVVFTHWVNGHFEAIAESPDLRFDAGDPGGHAYTVLFDEASFGIASGFDFFVVTGGHDASGVSLGHDYAPALTDGAYTFWTFHVVAAPWSVTGSLVGLLGDGSVYILGEDGQFHYIDAATFAAKGYDGNAVSWLGQLPANIGAPIPAVAPAPAPEATVVPRAPESVAVVVPAIGKGFTTPGTVLAGKKVVVSFPVTDAATGANVTELTMFSSNPKIGNTIVKHVEKLVGGYATITLKVPKTAVGKSLQVGLTVKTGDQSASKTQTFRIH